MILYHKRMGLFRCPLAFTTIVFPVQKKKTKVDFCALTHDCDVLASGIPPVETKSR